MFKLLKNMRPKEIIMSIICIIFILGQIYFDLLLPDYMSELTTLINTVGSEINDIVLVGFNMKLERNYFITLMIFPSKKCKIFLSQV